MGVNRGRGHEGSSAAAQRTHSSRIPGSCDRKDCPCQSFTVRTLMEDNDGGGAAPTSGGGGSGDRFLMAGISSPHPQNDVLMGRGCES